MAKSCGYADEKLRPQDWEERACRGESDLDEIGDPGFKYWNLIVRIVLIIVILGIAALVTDTQI